MVDQKFLLGGNGEKWKLEGWVWLGVTAESAPEEVGWSYQRHCCQSSNSETGRLS